MIYFILMKNIIFPIFHEDKNTKLNYFSSISKRAKFRMLQARAPLCPRAPCALLRPCYRRRMQLGEVGRSRREPQPPERESRGRAAERTYQRGGRSSVRQSSARWDGCSREFWQPNRPQRNNGAYGFREISAESSTGYIQGPLPQAVFFLNRQCKSFTRAVDIDNSM